MKQKKYDEQLIERREKVNKKKLFTLIPLEIFEDKSLKVNEKIILTNICSYMRISKCRHI